ncbi:MAG: hypothetical protein ACP5U1_07790 [Desulfomonilaceae bacterium]
MVSVLCVMMLGYGACLAVGIAPEQIYQPEIDWQKILGTWEKLPEVTPLSEIPNQGSTQGFRTLMTLRKDGTCRVFNADNPSGIDGVWTHKDHAMFVTISQTNRLEFFIYGIKDGFMVTRSPLRNGLDQLWSRVK